MSDPVEVSDPEIGVVIADRYRVVARLGEGGMGAVYRAEHLQLAKPVAIKLLRPELVSRKDAEARFEREAVAGARLSHPNVVGVLDFGTRDDGSLYLVMELLQGESLREVLDREGALPWPRAVGIARQVLRGLAHAHDQGVLHRDLKPENIQLSPDDDGAEIAKLIDFGIAMLIAGEGADVRLTAAGLAVGTPSYLAPEQAVGGKLGPPTDLYSLSVVLFEMLAGRPPFVSDEPVRLLTAHAMTAPPLFAEVAPDVDVPSAIEAVVRRGLAKLWAERFTTAAEYVAELDAARQGAEGRARGPSPHASSAPVIAAPPSAELAPPAPPSAELAPAASPVAALPAAAPPAPIALTPVPRGPAAVVSSTPAPPAPPAPQAPPAPPAPQARAAHAASRSPALPRPTRVAWPPSRKRLGIGAAVLVGIVVAVVVARSGGSARPGGAVLVPHPVVIPSPTERDTVMKAAIYDLTDGKTCADRKKAVAKLRALGDARAIPALKKARFRMRGGVLGIGDSNTNACLRKDAEAAIIALGGDLK